MPGRPVVFTRLASICSYEFGEVLRVALIDSVDKKPYLIIRVPLGNGNFEHYLSYSVQASKGIVPNQIAREVFFLTNFLEQKDWKDNLSSYADFCDCKL